MDDLFECCSKKKRPEFQFSFFFLFFLGRMVLLKVGPINNAKLGYSDAVFVTEKVFLTLVEAPGEKSVPVFLKDCSFVFRAMPTSLRECTEDRILIGNFHRVKASIRLEEEIQVRRVPIGEIPQALSLATFELSLVGLRDATFEHDALVTQCRHVLHEHVLEVNQNLLIEVRSIPLRIKVLKVEPLVIDLSDEEKDSSITLGTFVLSTDVEFKVSTGGGSITILSSSSSSSSRKQQLFQKNFDFSNLGIGGLGKELMEIFRRAFASRMLPPAMVEKMGLNHVRGMLMYGAPGCGKTLIARRLGKALKAREPKVVNGPEILNKFVGQSEENIRKLFADAEADWKSNGIHSDLHIIIFDEIDAICKRRGSSSSSTGVNDSVVNQLLSKMDGVDSLNNILVIGMTNRLDMIDEALLRPGRMEVHVEIGLPDEEGRLQILNIHTEQMRKNKFLSDDVRLEEVASKTRNFTGAELEGLVREARNFSLQRHVDFKDLSVMDVSNVKVTMGDFLRAADQAKPMFGNCDDDLKMFYPNGIISHGPAFEELLANLEKLTKQVMVSKKTPLLSACICGPSGYGKTALSAFVGSCSKYPFVKRLGAETLVGMSDVEKTLRVKEMFDDAARSPLSFLILDDLERLIEFIDIGPRFSNPVLQALMVLIRTPPKKGKLFLLGTTSSREKMSALGLLESFDAVFDVPAVENVKKILGVDDKEEFPAVTNLGVKKILNAAEMSMVDDAFSPVRFLEALKVCGV